MRMSRRKSKGTLFSMIVFSFVPIFFIAAIILTSVFLGFSFEKSKNDYLQYNQMLLSSLENRISTYFNGINSSSRVILANEYLWDYVSGYFKRDERIKVESDLESRMRVLLSNMYYYSYHLESIELFLPETGVSFTIDSDVLLNNKSFSKNYSELPTNEWLRAAVQTPGYKHTINDATGGLDVSIALQMPFSDETAFVFKYSLSSSFWAELIKDMSMQNEIVMILSRTNSISYCSSPEYVDYQPIIRSNVTSRSGYGFMDIDLDQPHLMTYYNDNSSDWIVVKAIPSNSIYADFRTSILTYLLCCALVIIVILLVSISVSKKIANPIQRLTKGLSSMTPERFSLNEHYLKDNEIGMLYKKCHEIVDMINNLVKKGYEHELSEKEAQLKILQLQLNPHFIYNVLQLLSNIAIESNNTEIEEITDAFGLLLRYNLANDNKKVRVIEEINALNKYLFIIQKSYGSRLLTNVQIDPQTEHLSIIPFVLQPIVENSFKHGLSRKVGHIEISVSTYIRNNKLVIEIKDNGIGMEERIVYKINNLQTDSVLADDIVGGKGLGLIQKRIQLEYGKPYGIYVESLFNIGTTVHMTFPITTYQAKENEK